MTEALDRDDQAPLFQIGEVAERVGLSLRTIRYYEEIGMVVPSARTEGGFRLYRLDDVRRLEMAKALKPTGISLDDLGEILGLAEKESLSASERRRLRQLIGAVRERIARLRMRIDVASDVVERLGQR